MFRACLDTSVLVPSTQRDFLLQLAIEGAYAPVWGSGVLEELDEVLERLHGLRKIRADAGYRRKLLANMRDAFPGATVEAAQEATYDYALHDPEDAHVVHAAIYGSADVLVTSDRKAGFDQSPALASAEVEVLLPADFAANTVAAHPRLAVKALEAMAARSMTPVRTTAGILEHLRDTHGMREVHQLLASSLSRI